MLPLDLVEVLRQELTKSRREPDALLHASSDLIGSLRHAQLRAAGAPRIDSEIVSDTRLMTGTMWHHFMHQAIERTGSPFMQEVRVDRWLPEGWSGTADWIFWDAEAGGWVLGDLKTCKGEGIRWIIQGGAKEEHIWQLSAYWHALYDMGLPLVDGFAIFYLPMNDVIGENIEPRIEECAPLPKELVWGVMQDRMELTQRYLDSLKYLDDDDRWNALAPGVPTQEQAAFYVTEYLAPPMERVQKVVWNGKQKVFDLKLVPHWSCDYCPYPVELCDCSQQGVNKIGHYTLDEEYVPREDYELELPAEKPSGSEYRRRREEASASTTP
jgi:hypothetical protein